MKKIILSILVAVLAIFGLTTFFAPQLAHAACDGVETAILNCDEGSNGEGIFYILGIIINVLTFGVGAAATIGIVIAGYQYMTAKDNTAQILKAKNRILQVVIGVAMYALFWAIINFLIPGGLV